MKAITSAALRRLNAVPGWRTFWKSRQFGSIETRVNYAISDRPNYAYGIYRAADLARRLDLRAISVAEFGVAGGNGLIAMERIADEIGRYMGIDIAVYGFDTGEGMPQSEGYKDLPFYFQPRYYKMDVEKLRPRLRRAQLLLGEVADPFRDSWSSRLRRSVLSPLISTITARRGAPSAFSRDWPRAGCRASTAISTTSPRKSAATMNSLASYAPSANTTRSMRQRKSRTSTALSG